MKNHIEIETDASGYAIGRVFSQLNFNSDVSPNDLNKSDFAFGYCSNLSDLELLFKRPQVQGSCPNKL